MLTLSSRLSETFIFHIPAFENNGQPFSHVHRLVSSGKSASLL